MAAEVGLRAPLADRSGMNWPLLLEVVAAAAAAEGSGKAGNRD